MGKICTFRRTRPREVSQRKRATGRWIIRTTGSPPTKERSEEAGRRRQPRSRSPSSAWQRRCSWGRLSEVAPRGLYKSPPPWRSQPSAKMSLGGPTVKPARGAMSHAEAESLRRRERARRGGQRRLPRAARSEVAKNQGAIVFLRSLGRLAERAGYIISIKGVIFLPTAHRVLGAYVFVGLATPTNVIGVRAVHPMDVEGLGLIMGPGGFIHSDCDLVRMAIVGSCANASVVTVGSAARQPMTTVRNSDARSLLRFAEAQGAQICSAAARHRAIIKPRALRRMGCQRCAGLVARSLIGAS